jgi:hypothetical protein
VRHPQDDTAPQLSSHPSCVRSGALSCTELCKSAPTLKEFLLPDSSPRVEAEDSEWYKLLPAREKDVLGFTLCNRPQVC